MSPAAVDQPGGPTSGAKDSEGRNDVTNLEDLAADAEKPDPLLGQRIGKYFVVGKLGEGGFGSVYRVDEPVLGKEFALKVLHEDYSRSSEFRSRFLREIGLMLDLAHENIVVLRDFGEHGDALYYTMDLVRGRGLRDVMKDAGPMAPERAVALTAQILDGLAAAHRKNIVHRDLKPGNVLVIEDDGAEKVRIVDFGIARVVEEAGGTNLTGTGIIGTPAYMSPEQASGESVTPHSDLYAVGVMLYEMLAGKRPFDAPTTRELLMQHITVPPPKLDRSLCVPKELGDVLYRALAKDKSLRPQSAEDFRQALQAALQVRRRVPSLAGALKFAVPLGFVAAAAFLVVQLGLFDGRGGPQDGGAVALKTGEARPAVFSRVDTAAQATTSKASPESVTAREDETQGLTGSTGSTSGAAVEAEQRPVKPPPAIAWKMPGHVHPISLTSDLPVFLTRESTLAGLQVSLDGGLVGRSLRLKQESTTKEETLSADGGNVSLSPLDLPQDGDYPYRLVAFPPFDEHPGWPFKVVRDSVPPRIEVKKPRAGSVIREASVVVEGTVTDVHLVREGELRPGAKVEHAGKMFHEEGFAPEADGSFHVSLPLPPGVVDTEVQLTVRAADLAGNSPPASPLTLRIDRIPPALKSPPQITTVESSPAHAPRIHVEGIATEPLQRAVVGGVDARVEGLKFVSEPLPVKEGANRIEILLVDAAGIEFATSADYEHDTRPPALVEVSFEADAGGKAKLNVLADEPLRRVKVNDGAVQLEDGAVRFSYELGLRLEEELKNAEWGPTHDPIRIQVEDRAGNERSGTYIVCPVDNIAIPIASELARRNRVESCSRCDGVYCPQLLTYAEHRASKLRPAVRADVWFPRGSRQCIECGWPTPGNKRSTPRDPTTGKK
jgi:hypothetical protein